MSDRIVTLSNDDATLSVDLLSVAAQYLRALADRGPRMSPLLCDTLLGHANTAERLRARVAAAIKESHHAS